MLKTLKFIVIMAFSFSSQLSGQSPLCLADTAKESTDARHDFGVRVSLTDPAAVAERISFGLPALSESQVAIANNTSTCALAGSAFYSTFGLTADSTHRFIVLQAGNRRIVRLAGQTSHYTAHAVFDDTFSTVISKFWH